MEISRSQQLGARILSLDDGGVRSFSTTTILRSLMVEVQNRESLQYPPKPCEYFDLIGGAGSGGLLVILLGRVRLVYL